MQPLTVALVDPSPISLLGEIEILLCAGITVAGTLTDILRLPALLDSTPCDMAIVDPQVRPRDTASHGMAVIEALADARPSLAIILLMDATRGADTHAMRRLLGTGVRGIVHKAAPWSALPAAVYTVASGSCYVSHAVRLRLDEYPPIS